MAKGGGKGGSDVMFCCSLATVPVGMAFVIIGATRNRK